MNIKLKNIAAAFLAVSVMLTSSLSAASADILEYSPENLQQAIEKISNEPQAPVVFTLTSKLNVYINGEASINLSDEYRIGEKVTLTAPKVEGKEFIGWETETPNGEKSLASTKADFTLVLNSDINAYALYENIAGAQKSVVSFTSVKPLVYAGKNAFSLTATRSIPEGNKISATGVVYTNNKLLGAESADNVLKSSKDELVYFLTDEQIENKAVKTHEVEVTDNSDGDWTLNIVPSADDMRYYIMSYIVVNGEKIYSEPISLTYESMKDATSDMINSDISQDNTNS